MKNISKGSCVDGIVSDSLNMTKEKKRNIRFYVKTHVS